MNTNYGIIFTKRQTAEFLPAAYPEKPLADELIGKTLVSVVSSGSETGGFMGYGGNDENYPCETGYAGIMEVLEIGSNVTTVKVGDYIFSQTSHRLYNKTTASRVFVIPKDAPLEKAILCRFPAVSMTAFLQSSIKPTEPAMVSGLGIVGLMCAQMMRRCGFTVYAVDPLESRRAIAKKCGLVHVEESPSSFGLPEKSVGIGMDCSGNDLAISAMIPYLRQGGELSLVGVPWKRSSDIYAHDLLRQIFYSYLHVYSGFEWSLPLTSGAFDPNSNYKSMQTALGWILEDSIVTDGIYEVFDPADCSTLYPAIASNRLEKPCVIFDWRSY